MSQTVITTAFEQWKARQAASNEPVLLDEFVFANVPGLDPSLPVNRTEQLPDARYIVHRQPVTRTGVVNANRVVYSVVLGADTGDFDFNWIGLINKASGTLAMVVHAPVQQKLKTRAGQQGNVLTRSFLMEYNGAATQTEIRTPAETWQIDFTARLSGVDERQRVENVDVYGQAAFFGDGWLLVRSGDDYVLTAGIGYVAGLRVVLPANRVITPIARPYRVFVDASFTGQLTSAWEVSAVPVVAAALADYDQNGVHHYVFPVAQVNADGTVTDMRPKGSLAQQQSNNDFMRKAANLGDLVDKAAARNVLGLGSRQVPWFGSIELSGATPFLDFHADSTPDDYTDRLIATGDGLHYSAMPGRKFTSDSPAVFNAGTVTNAVASAYGFHATMPASPQYQGLTVDWNGIDFGMAGFTNNQGAGTGGFAFRTVNATNTVEFGRVTFTQDGQVKATRALWAGEAIYATDGNSHGTMWGVNGAPDWLSNNLNRRFGAIPVNNATGDVSGTAWGGSLAVNLTVRFNDLQNKISAIPVDNATGNIRGSAWGNDWLSNHLANKWAGIQGQFNAIPVDNLSGNIRGSAWGNDWLSNHLANKWAGIQSQFNAIPVDNLSGNIHGSAWGNDWLSNYINNRFAGVANRLTMLSDTNGYFVDVVTGFMFQFGWIQSATNEPESHGYNIAFPNKCSGVICQMGLGVNNGHSVYALPTNQFGFTYRTSSNGLGFMWFAWGK
ncbi:phage tail protein [Phytobacter ursingii]